VLAGGLLALMLAGCQTSNSTNPESTGSLGDGAVLSASDLSSEQALAAVQKWGALYAENEKDKVVALNYAAALRAANQTGQGVAVMRKSAIYHPSDREVLGAFGKALAADGRFREALATVRRAQRADNPDWQLLATEGGILDSLGQHEQARNLYQQGLVLAPGEPQLLNNLGLSYLLTSELDKAETVLREAAASPKATLKVRDNLALVLKLQGEDDGAPPLAGGPEAAAGDSTVLKVPPKPQDIWEELAESG
jgi:Flp pilus assembly protein TadD